jgi:K+-transporting ATPase ATPase A chain
MAIVFVTFTAVTIHYEQAGNPLLTKLGVDQTASAMHAGGNMEGKETRFGVVNSAIWATAATVTSNGSAISMHDSYTPLGGMVLLASIHMGEVIFGGVGSGLYGMLVYVIVAMLVAGLMIGRTPEYLGKKIGIFDVKMASLLILSMPVLALIGTAIAVMVEPGKAGVANPGAHGFSEILYAFSSAANNNGSAFGGLSANTPFYNTLLTVAIWFGRYVPIVAALAIAGSLAAKKRVPPGPATMPTHGPLFVGLLIGTVILIGALSYLPALALGPVIEHLQMIGVH